LGLTHRIHLRH